MVDVATAAGISVETLRKIERGRVPTPAFFTVAAVADAVGISLDALHAGVVRRDEPDPPPARATPMSRGSGA